MINRSKEAKKGGGQKKLVKNFLNGDSKHQNKLYANGYRDEGRTLKRFGIRGAQSGQEEKSDGP